MKKSVIFLAIFALLILGWALKDQKDLEQYLYPTFTHSLSMILPSEEKYTMTGTIVYYNHDLDRGSGLETNDPTYSVKFIPSSNSQYMQFYSGKNSYYGWLITTMPIALWCAKLNSTTLSAALLKAKKYKSWDQNLYNLTGDLYDRDTKKLNTLINYTIPSDLSGKVVSITLTRPIFTYDKIVRDMPDRGRPGDCTADSMIKGTISVL